MKKEVAEEITDAFIAALQAGTVPWRKPWSGSGLEPRNYYSNRPYRGINTLILGLASQMQGYESPCWTTYKAAEQRGAQVRKGEKSTKIIFWKPLKVEDRDNPDQEKSVILARLYSVFNTDQIDGIDWQQPEQGEPISVPDALNTIVAGYNNAPEIIHQAQDRAYYSPGQDKIYMPNVSQFSTVEGYAETILHELTHSTGVAHRLHRYEITDHIHGNYAKEELVAEIGAAMLMNHAGITQEFVTENTTAYIASWLKSLENDHTLIIKAAQAAQKSCDHILGAAQEESLSEAA